MLCIASGCNESELNSAKSLPAPISNEFPYEIPSAWPMYFWGGDNFEVNDNGVLHCLVLQGVDSPKPGQKHYRESRKFLKKRIGHRPLRIVVYGVDDHKREIGRAYVGDVDLNIELIRAGMGWYDGNDFEDAHKFKQAELDARKDHIGLWSSPNPVHPSEFENQRAKKKGENN